MAKSENAPHQTCKQVLAVLLTGAALTNLVACWMIFAELSRLEEKTKNQMEWTRSIKDTASQSDAFTYAISVAKFLHNLHPKMYALLALSILAIIASAVLWKDAGGKFFISRPKA